MRQYRADNKNSVVTLGQLMEITKRVFAKSPRIGPVVCQQMEDMKKKIGAKLWQIEGNETPLGELVIEDFYKQKVNPDNRKHLRNFIAHSGFEYNITMVKADWGIGRDNLMEKVRLYYTDNKLAFHFTINALKRLDFCEARDRK
jgi:CRISPR/Cas system-associated protein Csx1